LVVVCGGGGGVCGGVSVAGESALCTVVFFPVVVLHFSFASLRSFPFLNF
jgi:hypothetical protein